MLRSVLHGSMHKVISDISRKKRRRGWGGEGEGKEGNIVELGGNAVDSHSTTRAVTNGNQR